jgi:cysteinyl-tRNA synthetase
MSKSKGEFLTVSLLTEKGFDPMVYRFFCLQSHYRKSLVFSWENMENAKAAYNKLIARIATLKEEGEIDPAVFEEQKAGFVKSLDNDLNTSLAVTAIYDVLKAKTNDATKRALLADFDRVLCLDLLEHAAKLNEEKNVEAAKTPISDDPFVAEIEKLIEERKQAKAAKNYAEADRIRTYLLEKGVTLIDSREGTTFRIEGKE